MRVAESAPVDHSASSKKKVTTTTTTPVNIALSGPQKFALERGIRNQALKQSHLKPTAGIGFGSRLNDTQDMLDLYPRTPVNTKVVVMPA